MRTSKNLPAGDARKLTINMLKFKEFFDYSINVQNIKAHQVLFQFLVILLF